MPKTTFELEEQELTEEGKRLWENIARYEQIMEGNITPTKVKKIRELKLNIFETELYAFRLELKRMIKNSKMVIEDCDKIIATYKTAKEYLASDAKVARAIHTSLIIRLERILNGKSAFDHIIEIPEEERERDNKFYRIPGKSAIKNARR